MRIHVVNPNTTRSMTLKIGAAAKAAASPGVEVSAANPDFGPPSIEGYFDEAFSIPGLIEEIGKAATADAFVIACFDDTGLEAARCACAQPGRRHRRSRVPHGEPHRGEIQRRHHAFALDRADRAQPHEIRA